ncbi:MAG: hypothetical protein M3461_03755 [Pseudomonadota bacterium]|nr:hypothetical protein [Pseudomonadota bacterium]
MSRATVAMGRRIILSSRKRGKHSHFVGVTAAPAPAARMPGSSFQKITRVLTLPWKLRNFRTMKWAGACPS